MYIFIALVPGAIILVTSLLSLVSVFQGIGY
jgi:hypothetical protein